MKADQHYLYELRGVLADGTERRLAVDIPVWAGALRPSRSAVGAQHPGRATGACSCCGTATRTRRRSSSSAATSPGGPFQQVNPKPVAYDMDAGLDGQPLPAPQPGFLDIGAWDPDGTARSAIRSRAAPCTARQRTSPTGTRSRHATRSTGRAPGRRRSPPPLFAAFRADGPGRASGLAEHLCRRARRHVAQGDAQRREPRAARRLARPNYVYRGRDAARSSRTSLRSPPIWSPLSRPTRRTPPRRSCRGPTSTRSSSRRTARSRSSIASRWKTRSATRSAPSAVITGAVPDTTPARPHRPHRRRLETPTASGSTGSRTRSPTSPATRSTAGSAIAASSTCPGITHVKDKEGTIITRGESRYRVRHDTCRRRFRRRRQRDVRGRRADLVRRHERPRGLAALLRLLGPRLRPGRQPLRRRSRLPATRGVPLRTAAREDAAAGAGHDRAAGPQQRRARRVDLVSGAGPPRLPRLPLRRGARPAAVPRLRLHRRHGQRDAVGRAGPVVRRRARRSRSARRARLLPRRHRRAAPRLLVPRLGARLARQRERRRAPSSTSRRAARSRTRATCRPTPAVLPPAPRRERRLRPRRQLGPDRSTPTRSRASSCSAAATGGPYRQVSGHPD